MTREHRDLSHFLLFKKTKWQKRTDITTEFPYSFYLKLLNFLQGALVHIQRKANIRTPMRLHKSDSPSTSRK